MVIFDLWYWSVFNDDLFDILENERWVLRNRQMIHEV